MSDENADIDLLERVSRSRSSQTGRGAVGPLKVNNGRSKSVKISKAEPFLSKPDEDDLVAGLQDLSVAEETVQVVYDPRTLQLHLYNAALGLRDVCAKVTKLLASSKSKSSSDDFLTAFNSIKNLTARLLERKKRVSNSIPSILSSLTHIKEVTQLLTKASKWVDAKGALGQLKLATAQLRLLCDSLSIVADRAGLLKTGKFANAVELDLQGIANYMKGCKRIVIMSGAGISVSAGIPDFRSPNGLYLGGYLAKYNLPTPTSIFTLDYFKKSPEPFFDLAKELYPGKWRPTTAHYLVSMLSAKGMLLRNYTQNIDGLELLAGVEERDLIAAHGTFGSATCMGAQCKKAFPSKIVRDSVFAGTIPRCDSCNSVIKPDVVMFGEDLPQKFFQSTKHDFPSADLLIVMGTSLAVTPFNTLIDKVPESTPRLLINRDKVGMQEEERKKAAIRGFETTGFSFDDPSNIRDVFAQGNCDDVVLKLVHLMGWSTEFTNYKTEMTEKAQEIALKHGFCTQ